MSEILSSILPSIAYLASSIILILLARILFKLFHPAYQIKEELVDKDNPAFSISYLGYLAGVLAVIGGCIIGPSYGLLEDVRLIFAYGIGGIILLNISMLWADKVILPHFSIKKEISKDRNIGVGAIEGGIGLASGLILMGSIYGEGSWISALVFYFIGQIIFFIISKIYDKLLPFNLHRELEHDNAAVGFAFAGILIAVANIIRFACMKHFDHIFDTAIEVGYDLGFGLILLPISRIFIDRIILKGRKLTDELINQETPNVGAGALEGFGYIGVSILLSWVL